jgi:hypothetical protein
MSDQLSETAIVRAVAEEAARRITRKTITVLRRMKQTLSGDDSELDTTWDEICVQIQHEESLSWEVYEEATRALVAGYVDELPKYVKQALWLQSEAGIEWDFEEPDEREPDPLLDDDIIDNLLKEHVLCRSGQMVEHPYSNLHRPIQHEGLSHGHRPTRKRHAEPGHRAIPR